MVAMPFDRPRNDDPRKLRELLDKVRNLADAHQLKSVVVGMSSAEGDLLFPDIVDFVGSALRVDDAIFRMTRSRAVFFIADADRERAEDIMQRVLKDFGAQLARSVEPAIALAYFEVSPGVTEVTLKDVLPALFAPPPQRH